MKHIQIYENFHEGPMRKPEGFLSKLAKGAKHAMGYENEEDRKSLRSIHRAIGDTDKYGYVTNVREIQPGVVIASLLSSSVTVDMNTPEIMYKGKVLDLHNTEEEVGFLYNALMRLKADSDFKTVRAPYLNKQIDSDSIAY
jgi:superfamily I DNA/RNA helicase